jgi:hypothetical protein
MLRRILFVASGVSALTLAGCGGGGKGVAPVQPQPPMAVRLEDQFGAGFGLSFRNDRNIEPGDPQPADLEPVSLTTEPREVN